VQVLADTGVRVAEILNRSSSLMYADENKAVRAWLFLELAKMSAD